VTLLEMKNNLNHHHQQSEMSINFAPMSQQIHLTATAAQTGRNIVLREQLKTLALNT